MATLSKKEIVERIAAQTSLKRTTVKQIVQTLLDTIVEELCRGNRLEFREFGVFETRQRSGRMAQNPRTLEPVAVTPRRSIKFRPGRTLKKRLRQPSSLFDEATGLPLDIAPPAPSPRQTPLLDSSQEGGRDRSAEHF